MSPFLPFYYLCHINPQKIMEMLRYFYHPDHLGSSNWITDASGIAIQHLHYLPFGEDWVDKRNSSWNALYTFSGKEKDAETGYGYFGTRYYDSGLSIWLSVDPMSDKYPSMSPYNYCANNSLRFKDPTGLDFYDQNANFLGKSVEKGVFIVINTAEINLIKDNEAQGKSTSSSEVHQAVKIPSKAIRSEVVEKSIAADKANPYREYSGYFGQTQNGKDHVSWANLGTEGNPCVVDKLTCNPFDLVDKGELGLIWNREGEFHTYPSGICAKADFSNTNSVLLPPLIRGFFIAHPS